MRNIKSISLFLFGLLLITFPLKAQNSVNYLAGAVPEVDGKVTFAKTIHLPGVDKEKIYQQISHWMEEFLKREDPTSRIVYRDIDEGVVVGLATDTIVFKSTALSLDRTFMSYQLEAVASNAQCDLQISKITYRYQEKERYTAEEMISDKVALNKAKTKIYAGLQKWRKKTIDHVEAVFEDATKSLSQLQTVAPVPTAVIAPTTVEQLKGTPTNVNKTPSVKAVQAATNINFYEFINHKEATWFIKIGNSPITYNITEEFGGIGQLRGNQAIYLIVPPTQEYADILDENDTITLYFARKDIKKGEPFITIICKKVVSQRIDKESISENLKESNLKNATIYINEIISVDINK